MKRNVLLLSLLTIIFIISYALLTADKNERIREILEDESRYLEISYNQGLDRFHVIAENVYISLQNNKTFVSTFANVQKNGLQETHDALYLQLKDEFVRLQQLGVMGLQIVLPNNVSLLRMHKVDKCEDNLTSVRYSLDYVNKHKTHLHGFEEGRTSHAFRELYPIFNDGEYLGVLEILFSSTRLQDYTMRASNIHTHFIVDKNVFEVNAWKSNLTEPYEQSIEHADYLFSQSDHMQHNRLDNSNKNIITPLRAEIDAGIAKKEVFEVYKKVGEEIKVVTFLPIHRIQDAKVVAYLLSYTSSEKVVQILLRYNMLVVTLLLIAFLIYIVAIVFLSNQRKIHDELKYDLLTKVLNRKYFFYTLQNSLKNSKGEMIRLQSSCVILIFLNV